jgi:hypothetical protein
MVTTWHSKRRRSPTKGGATSRRGTPREAWGNSYIAANSSPRRTAAWRGATWKSLNARASYSNSLTPVQWSLCLKSVVSYLVSSVLYSSTRPHLVYV